MNHKIFLIIREAKKEITKKVFLSYGQPFDKIANVLTADELVKSFDYFNAHSEMNDNEESEAAMIMDYSDYSQNFLSPESIYRIKTEVFDDFFR